jgi:hypothetical protein
MRLAIALAVVRGPRVMRRRCKALSATHIHKIKAGCMRARGAVKRKRRQKETGIRAEPSTSRSQHLSGRARVCFASCVFLFL